MLGICLFSSSEVLFWWVFIEIGFSLHVLFWALMACFSWLLGNFPVQGIKKEGIVEEVFLWH